MSCETVTGSIVALLDGELVLPERREVEGHIAACPECAREADALRATRRVVARHLAALGEQARPRFAEVWERVEAEQGHPAAGSGRAAARPMTSRAGSAVRPGRGRRRRLWAGVSAGVALAAGLVLLVLSPPFSELAPRSRAVDGGRAAADASATAARVVPAEPVKASASRVSKSAVNDAPAREQVARRTSARGEPETDTPDTPDAAAPAEELVAVNELDPPRELLERPDLFLNYPIVRKLDALRNLDAVLAGQGADPLPGDGGAG